MVDGPGPGLTRSVGCDFEFPESQAAVRVKGRCGQHDPVREKIEVSTETTVRKVLRKENNWIKLQMVELA